MGLSIHYSGRIRSYALVQALTDEVEDICKSLGWKYHIREKKSTANDAARINNPHFINYRPEDIKGITISPAECEPVDLTFFPSGILCSVAKLKYNNAATNDLMVETISTKTQFAGPDIHITVLKLLQYLKDKYFAVFELRDEGHYWKTKDKKILLGRFAEYNFLLDAVAGALGDFKAAPGETPASLADRLEEFLKKKFEEGKE
jgi:hypothetical protein